MTHAVVKILPRSRRAWLAAALACALVAGAALLASLERGGQEPPITFTAGPTVASLGAYPGQSASYAAFLASRPAGYRYQVSRVRLIRLPGFRAPRLLGAVFLRSMGPPTAAPGYPPRPAGGTRYLVHPLAGYTATSGSVPHRPELVLMYGLSGDRLGGYAVAGIQITYTVGQRSFTADIYSGAVLFYNPRHQTPARRRASDAAYRALENRAATALASLPGVRAATGG